MLRTARVIGCLLPLVVLGGCGGFDTVIGEGPASLVFDNDGPNTIEVRVRWTEEGGTNRSRRFDVDPIGLVELRLVDVAEYRIELTARCDSTSAAPAPAERRVIALDGAEAQE